MATTKETVLARISIDDNTKVGFQSYARNAERAKKTTEAFRAHAVDKLVESLDKQVLALGKNARELDLLKAATLSASDAEFASINNLHDKIDAHNKATEASIRGRKEAELQEAATKRIADAVNRTNNAYRDEAATVDMTSDELEIYRLKMMGATQEQLDSVTATQQATQAFRKQGSAAAGTAKGGLRLMRGGLGQVGHQVQDIAVQLQMGQNAMLIFGQQGSQIASLFGQNGALIGALLAVGAAIGTSLAPALFKTRNHLEELEEVAERVAKVMSLDFVSGTGTLTDEIVELGQVSEDLARRKLKGGLEAAILSVTVAQEGLLEKIEEFDTRSKAGLVVPQSIGELKTEFGITRDAAEELIAAAVAVGQGVDGAVPAFDSLLHSIQNTETATTEQKKALLDARTAINELTEAELLNEKQIDALTTLQANFSEELKGSTDDAKKLSEAQREVQQTVDGLVSSLQNEIVALEVSQDSAQILKLANQGLSDSEIELVMALTARVTELQKANKETAEAANIAKDAANSTKNYVNGVVAQADALGKSNIELLLANDLVKGLDTEQKKAFDNAIQRLKDFQAAQEESQKVESSKNQLEGLRQSLMTEEQALLESFAEQNRVIAEGLALGNETEQSARDLQLQILAKYLEDKKALLDQGVTDELEGMSFLQKASIEGTKRLETFNKLSATEQTQHVLGELSGQFNGIAKNNKKLFELSKKLNIASAIMNTADAATLAYKSYPPPLNYVMAGGVIAAGMGQVAQIKAQSFDGGGFTGTGGRSGGMDGKGGFPAILHPNETVIDHTKGQGGGITVVNNIDATGAGADVDMKIRAAMQQTSQQTILSIQDLMRRRRFG